MMPMSQETRLFNMRADASFFGQLDELRRREPDLPNRTEMVRRLVESAYNAEAEGSKPLHKREELEAAE